MKKVLFSCFACDDSTQPLRIYHRDYYFLRNSSYSLPFPFHRLLQPANGRRWSRRRRRRLLGRRFMANPHFSGCFSLINLRNVFGSYTRIVVSLLSHRSISNHRLAYMLSPFPKSCNFIHFEESKRTRRICLDRLESALA